MQNQPFEGQIRNEAMRKEKSKVSRVDNARGGHGKLDHATSIEQTGMRRLSGSTRNGPENQILHAAVEAPAAE